MQFKSIIAAIDIDDDLAEGVIRTADSLAQKDGAKLQVVSVWPVLAATGTGFSAELGGSSAIVTEALMEQHNEGRRDSLDALRAMTDRLAPSATAVLLDGEAPEEVAHYAEKQNADLIVTGSHQRKFWGSLFQGSASMELVREAPCAVFLVTKAFADTLTD
ncbi:universal stress protein [Hyphococcus sp.]|jgi:nucleotide-binding universal stress UspA family protein|uniref:universal stress protein n=1 Tax=Hyphococcus sp. TaxID=2038636 RepID=UPI003D146641